MAFPSTFSSFTRPTANDRLNNPSHSALHNSVSSAVGQLEAVIGLEGDSSVLGTLSYDVRSPASDGGGHIQTANKGGTGQTSYNKGDMLVATSSSVLAKLAIGSVQGAALVVDDSQTAGVRWASQSGQKLAVVSSQLGVSGVTTLTPIFGASILGSTLGTSNAVRFTGAISNLSLADARGVDFTVLYGNNTLLTFSGTTMGNVDALSGVITGTIIGNGNAALQKAVGTIVLTDGNAEAEADTAVNISKYMAASYGTSSVESSATQNLVINAQMTGANTFGSVVGQFIVVEKIV